MGQILSTTDPDAKLLAEIHAACFPTGWSVESITQMVANQGIITFIDEDKGGFGVLRAVEGEAEIITLCVRPDLRRQRLGSSILLSMLDWAMALHAKHIFLEVRESNEAALTLYEKAGFKRISLRKDYYNAPGQPPENAVVMRREL